MTSIALDELVLSIWEKEEKFASVSGKEYNRRAVSLTNLLFLSLVSMFLSSSHSFLPLTMLLVIRIF